MEPSIVSEMLLKFRAGEVAGGKEGEGPDGGQNTRQPELPTRKKNGETVMVNS